MQRETETERDRLKVRGRGRNQERMKGTETLRREKEGVLEPTRSSLGFPLPQGLFLQAPCSLHSDRY